LNPFDSLVYQLALTAGSDSTVEGPIEEAFWFNQRPIIGTSYFDGIGPHPYSFTLGTIKPEVSYQTLKNSGLVAFFGVISPDFEPSNEWEESGWKLVFLKQHFTHDPSLPLPVFSSRTRQNLQMAGKHWHVERVELRDHTNEIAENHAQMLAGKQVVPQLSHSFACFEAWVQLQAIKTYAARDKDGFGIWAIAGRRREHDKNELHLIAMAAAPRAYKTGGFYAIYNYLLHEIGRDTAIFFGGAPRYNEGLARFKSRFANAPKNVWGVQAIFQPEICAELQRKLGTFEWFPPYRNPFL